MSNPASISIHIKRQLEVQGRCCLNIGSNNLGPYLGLQEHYLPSMDTLCSERTSMPCPWIPYLGVPVADPAHLPIGPAPWGLSDHNPANAAADEDGSCQSSKI